MRPKQRQDVILQRIRSEERVDVEELADEYDVSPETIRRDLDALASTGAIHRVRGGAKRIKLTTEASLDDRIGENDTGKRAIAQKLTDLLDHGDTVFMDTGSTTLACASAIAGQPGGLTVITNSLGVAQRIGTPLTDHRVFLLGGRYSGDNIQTVGPMVIEQLGRFQADYAVVTVAAIDASVGAMDADEAEADVARAMCNAAKTTVVLADSAKLGRRAAFRVCRTDEIDVFISDVPVPPDLEAALQSTRAQIL